MEQSGLDLPEIPRGFEDYLAAARKVVEYAVYCPQPEIAYLPRSVELAYPDTIDTLDEVVAEYQQHASTPALLIYSFAYKLLMEDAVANTRNGYLGIRSLSTTIRDAETFQEELTTETSRQLLQIEKVMSEISETLTTGYVTKAMDRADEIVDNDTRLKRIFRKTMVLLGIKDDEKEIISKDWYGLSEIELRWLLRDLAIARARLLAED